ncbi:hypothetical protein SAMD00023353_2200330 [Rosellinia necatrix]|uniref:Uncharacterized protein n=1 Tax=Rosellinia necatrix TaxID=77044 RepID=A0A1S7UNS9_ROSNE|nr:hypothetical protein SAMD00023353_2200330 [Rosellinia necatrix]
MVDFDEQPPPNQSRALAIGFVENELKTYHQYYRSYDVTGSNPSITVSSSTRILKSEENIYKTMKSWDMIFPSAMEEFRNMKEVKAVKHSTLTHDISTGRTWNDVYSKFEAARQYYTDETIIKRRIQRVIQWTADIAAEPVRLAAKVVPQTEIVSPVLAVVQVVLDAIKKSAEARGEILDGFDELEHVFPDVEIFLETFPTEERILKLAVSLLASVLSAMDKGISFFTSLSHSEATLRILEINSAKLDGMRSQIEMLIDKADQEAELAKERENRQNMKIDHLIRSMTPIPPNLAGALQSPYLSSKTEMLSINQDDLWDLLDIFDIDTTDLETIEEKGKQLPIQDQARTEPVVNNQLFQDWIVSPRSAKLMIYGDFSPFHMAASALSLFCKTLANAFRDRKRYLCLVWFCGLHLGDNDESDTDSNESEGDFDDQLDGVYDKEDDYNFGTRKRVIERMIRSFIAQLLCDYDFGPGHLFPPDVDPDVIGQGQSLSQLRRLFIWLVRRLPEEITLVCLIDGISFYEREEFEDPMLDALGDILELTASEDMGVAVKVLVTSPRPSVTFRMGFEDGNASLGNAGETRTSILSLDLMAQSNVDASEDRVKRTLGLKDVMFTGDMA